MRLMPIGGGYYRVHRDERDREALERIRTRILSEGMNPYITNVRPWAPMAFRRLARWLSSLL